MTDQQQPIDSPIVIGVCLAASNIRPGQKKRPGFGLGYVLRKNRFNDDRRTWTHMCYHVLDSNEFKSGAEAKKQALKDHQAARLTESPRNTDWTKKCQHHDPNAIDIVAAHARTSWKKKHGTKTD